MSGEKHSQEIIELITSKGWIVREDAPLPIEELVAQPDPEELDLEKYYKVLCPKPFLDHLGEILKDAKAAGENPLGPLEPKILLDGEERPLYNFMLRKGQALVTYGLFGGRRIEELDYGSFLKGLEGLPPFRAVRL